MYFDFEPNLINGEWVHDSKLEFQLKKKRKNRFKIFEIPLILFGLETKRNKTVFLKRIDSNADQITNTK